MRKPRLVLAFLLATGPISAGLTACGGDDNAAGSAPDGGSTGTDSGGNKDTDPSDGGTDSAVGPQASASATTVYFGHAVTLDGSESTGPGGLTYAWTVATVPAGSSITTASLAGANTAKATFVPDAPGAYEMTLTIGAGAAKSSATVVANVVDPPVFFFDSENDVDAGHQAKLKVAGASARDAGVPVGCFTSDAGSFDGLIRDTAMAGADWWEAPAGQPSKVVFVFETREDGGASTVLAATTSAATCANGPTNLATFPGATRDTRAAEQPQFSPSGNRIAYVRRENGTTQVATIGFDGSDAHTLGAFEAFPDGGPNPEPGGTFGDPRARPVWLNDTTVAWLQRLDDDRWQIVSANDVADASPALLMSCSGSEPLQIDVLANGDVVVAQFVGNPEGATNILVYPIDPATKACGPARNLSLLTDNSYARDFALSPDRTRVAYAAWDSATNQQELLVARVDGTTPPVSVASPLGGANRGARWVGSGAFITWGIDGVQLDAGITGNAVAVVPSDGGVARAVAASPSGGTTEAIGNGLWSCSFAPAVGSGVSLFGIVGILALRLVRRRRS